MSINRVGVSVALALFAIALAIFSYTTPQQTASATPTAPVERAPSSDDQNAKLAARVDELQQSLAALKAQLVAQQNSRLAQRAVVGGDAKAPEIESVEAQRAADAERLKEYMDGVHHSFANEKVDAAWSSRVTSRVGSTFEGDETLRNIAHTVECRQQTCRVQIDDDGSG